MGDEQDFAAALAEAADASGEDTTTEDSAPVAKGKADEQLDSDTDEASGEAGESGEAKASDDAEDGADDSDDGADDDEDAAGSDEPAAGLDDIKKLFLKGDKDAALKALGLDPKILDVSNAKLRAMREGLAEARETKARADGILRDAAAKEAQAQAILKDGKARYGHLVDLKLALKAGDYTAAKDILEDLAPEGMTYRQIAEGIAKAAAGMSPSEVVYRKKLRELAEKEAREAEQREQAKAQEQTQLTKAEEDKRNLEGAKRALAGTDLADLPGAAEKLVELAAKAWDPIKKGLKVPREQLIKDLAKDPVFSQLLELRQLKSKGRPAAQKASTPERTPSGQFKRRQERVGGPPRDKEKDEFQAALAEATRMEAAERRARRAR